MRMIGLWGVVGPSHKSGATTVRTEGVDLVLTNSHPSLEACEGSPYGTLLNHFHRFDLNLPSSAQRRRLSHRVCTHICSEWGPITGGEEVYAQSGGQSQEGRRYMLRVGAP
eukprot:1195276-Prorocentrum_minimum.AAC.4